MSASLGSNESVFAQSGNLLLTDGASLRGELIRSDGDKVIWRSPLFLEPIEFATDELNSLRFTPAQKAAKEETHRFEFQNGDVILGKLVGATDKSVLIESRRIGRHEISRNDLVSISRQENTLFSGPRGLAGWVDSASSTFATSWVSNRVGSLSTSQKGAGIFYSLPMAEDLQIEFTLAAQKNPQFIFALGDDVEKSLRIETSNSDVVAANADKFGFMPLLEMASNTQSLTLRLAWNNATQQLVVYSAEGKKLAELSGKGCSPMSGIKLVNTGDDLRLLKATVRKKTVAYLDATSAHVVLADGTILKGSIASVADEKLKWIVAEDQAKPFTTDQIDFIQFPRHNGPSDLDANSLTQLLWNSGELLSGELLKTDADAIQLRSPLLSEIISVVRHGVTSISFGPSSKQTETRRRNNIEKADKLLINSSRLLGHLVFKSGDFPFHWQPLGSDRLYRLNPATSFQIVKGTTAKITWNQDEFSHRIHFNSGGAVRCRVLSMDEKQLRCQLPFTDEITIPSSEIKALVIGPRTLQRHFTKESQSRALTVPRFQQDDPFTHILIAKNDDLLRGRLIKISEDSVFFESCLEVVRIERNRISTIIHLDELKGGDSSSSATTQTESGHVQLMLRGGDHLVIEMKKLTQGRLIGDSPFFGKCSIPLESVEQFRFGNFVSKSQPDSDFAGWTKKKATAPRWKNTATGSPPDATKMIGRKLQSFELPGLEGKSFQSDDHAGKVLVLVYWATWSGPCKRAIPSYMKALSSYSTDDVLLIGINREEAPKAVRDYLKEQKLSGFRTLLDHQLQLFKRLQISSLPTTVIVGSDGTIEQIQAGYAINGAETTKKIVQQMLTGTWKRPEDEPEEK